MRTEGVSALARLGFVVVLRKVDTFPAREGLGEGFCGATPARAPLQQESRRILPATLLRRLVLTLCGRVCVLQATDACSCPAMKCTGAVTCTTNLGTQQQNNKGAWMVQVLIHSYPTYPLNTLCRVACGCVGGGGGGLRV